MQIQETGDVPMVHRCWEMPNGHSHFEPQRWDGCFQAAKFGRCSPAGMSLLAISQITIWLFNIAIENDHLQLVFPLKMVIYHSYVKFPHEFPDVPVGQLGLPSRSFLFQKGTLSVPTFTHVWMDEVKINIKKKYSVKQCYIYGICTN